ncbi:MAG: hypothetical protein HC853_01785 [Anaerolineae bacterium]|nr:hypothetical protein [Anaerolineae bacterium]
MLRSLTSALNNTRISIKLFIAPILITAFMLGMGVVSQYGARQQSAALDEIANVAANIQRDVSLPAFEPSAPLTYRDLQRLVRALARQNIYCIVLLDEFDVLSQNDKLDAEVFSGLRALAMQYQLTFVTASTQPLLDLTYAHASSLSSPFFNFFTQIRLGLFGLKDAQELLATLSARADAPFDETMIADLIRLAGLHPLLLQQAGCHAFETFQSEQIHPIQPRDMDLHRTVLRQKFLDSALSHFTYFWRNLTEKQKRVLALLPLLTQDDPMNTLRLEQAGLIVKSERGYAPFSASFGEFVARQPLDGLCQSPPLSLDLQQHHALLRGQPVALSSSEFNLLACLMAQPGQIVPHSVLETRLDRSDAGALAPAGSPIITTPSGAKWRIGRKRANG